MGARLADEAARHVFVSGRVQGVGYRAWLADAARAAGLRGFVRNRRDGRVEAVLIGPPAVVEAVIAAARRGPPAAAVSHVEIGEATIEVSAPSVFVVLETR
jgi:acylphosphatase